MGMNPASKPMRNKKGQFVKRVYKPSPFRNPLKRPAAVRGRTKALQYLTTVPRAYLPEPSSPPRPMGLREKADWERKSAIRKKKVKKLSSLHRRRRNKILKKAWSKIW
jgi:hypothetical protein